MMRLITCLLLCLPLCAWGETSFRCPDGTYVVNAGTPDCPTHLFSTVPGDLLADTTTNIQSPLSQTGGTLYWCIYPESSTDPSYDQLVAGNDGDDVACTDSSSTAVASTSFTGNATGLTASTSYKTAHTVLRNGKRSSVSISSAFQTLAGAAGVGTDLTNKGFFVDSGSGSDAGACEARGTFAAPYATLAKAQTCSQNVVGKNIYVLAGTTYNERLTIGWGGTESDPAEIRGYYNDGGTPREADVDVQGYWTINGGYTEAQYNAGTVNFSNAGVSGQPEAVQYTAAVTVASDWVEVSGFSVEQWATRGVTMSGVSNVIVENFYQFQVGSGAVVVENNSQDVVVRSGLAESIAMCDMQENSGGTGAVDFCPAPYAGAYVATRSSAPYGRILFENLDLYDAFAEGVSCVDSSHIIARGVRVSNQASTGFYLDACEDSVIEQSIIVVEPTGTGLFTHDLRYLTNGPRFTDVRIGFEDYLLPAVIDPVDNLTRNNLFVGAGSCGAMYMETQARSASRQTSGRFYHNTCIVPYFNSFTQGDIPAANIVEANTKYLNNVVYDNLGTGGCNITEGTFSNNFWTTTPSDTDCRDAGDVQASTPDFTLVQSLATWRDSYGSGTWPTFANVEPQATSPLVGAADTACVTEATLEGDDFGWVLDQMADIANAVITELDWEKGCKLDALNQTRVDDIGAVEYTP